MQSQMYLQRTLVVRKLLLFLTIPSAWAEVTETVVHLPYAVHQAEGTSLRTALNNTSPVLVDGKRYHAFTGWRVKWDYRWAVSPTGACAITSVNTSLTVTMTLPVLKAATPQASAEFRAYYPALLQHEEGHHKIGQDAARAVDRAITSLPPTTGCDRLEHEANRVGMDAVEHAKHAEKQYDMSTRYGCTQGACLGQ